MHEREAVQQRKQVCAMSVGTQSAITVSAPELIWTGLLRSTLAIAAMVFQLRVVETP
jgi:hypothetical protein